MLTSEHAPVVTATGGYSPPSTIVTLNQFLNPMEFLWLFGSAVWWTTMESLAYDSLAERMSDW
jgi:hypothetical protein